MILRINGEPSPHLGILGNAIKERIANDAEAGARALTEDIALGILEGLRDIIVDLSYSIALIGGGLAIILHVAGFERGKRIAGILTVSYVLIKYLLG